MAAKNRKEGPSKQRREAVVPKPREGQKAGSQGIVRDQRGQEQPADKERAQQTGNDE